MSEPKKYRKKPVVIEAMKMPVNAIAGLDSAMQVYRWIESNTLGSFDVNELWMNPDDFTWPASGVSIDARDGCMVIATLEGGHWVGPGDYVIRGVEGEFYACKPSVFEKTYERVSDPDANTLTNADLDLIRSITGLKLDTREPSKDDPWNPNSASFRYAADVLHALIGEVEAQTPEADIIEALRWEADRADADELARIYYPHLSLAEQAPVAEVWLNTLTERRRNVAQESAL